MTALLPPQLPHFPLPSWRGLARFLMFSGLCVPFLALLLYSNTGSPLASLQAPLGGQPHIHPTPNLTLTPSLVPSLPTPNSTLVAHVIRLTQAATRTIFEPRSKAQLAGVSSALPGSQQPGSVGEGGSSKGHKEANATAGPARPAEDAGTKRAGGESTSHAADSVGRPTASAIAGSTDSSISAMRTGANTSTPMDHPRASGVPTAATSSPSNRPHATPPHPSFMVPLTVLTPGEGPYSDGVCLDGSPPAYHLSPGWGQGSTKWVILLQGGAWCPSVQSCQKRAKTKLGSSLHMNRTIPFRGILSNASRANPYFFDWNRVYVMYCDGASFSGTTGAVPGVQGLHLQGHRVFLRIVHHLLVHRGLARATHVLLGGHSAGAIAALLHCDMFQKLISGASPSAQPLAAGDAIEELAKRAPAGHTNGPQVKCLADAGFFPFLEGVEGRNSISEILQSVMALHRPKVLAGCEDAARQGAGAKGETGGTGTERGGGVPRQHPAACLFPEIFLAHLTTPFFLLNSLYDSWMIDHILLGKPGHNSSWHQCNKRLKHCSPKQLPVLHGFRRAIIEKVQGLPLGMAKERQKGFWERNRALLFSCHNHSVSYTKFWHSRDSPRADGRSFAETVGAWFFGEIPGALFVDCEYPCNAQCI